MTNLMRILAASTGAAALAAAAPAAAQSTTYRYPNGSYGNTNPYSGYYGNDPYANRYGQNGYNGQNGYYGQNAYPNGTYNPYYSQTSLAQQQCRSAVETRLQSRSGVPRQVASLLGFGTPQVTSITEAKVTDKGKIRVKGFASSRSWMGRYGAGAYGALGYASNPDIEFRCTVYPGGQVSNVDIRKR